MKLCKNEDRVCKMFMLSIYIVIVARINEHVIGVS
jgi:hypothetical protein